MPGPNDTSFNSVNRAAMHRKPVLSNFRWLIVFLVFLATFINILNRLTIAVLGPTIMSELHLNNSQFASITSVFLVAYAISQGVSGKLYDKVGTKKGFIVSVVIWSVASISQAFSHGLASLNCFRFMLGLGEGGNWPGAAKVSAEWLPRRERALGMGICNSASTLGSIAAPPLVIAIQLRFGWHASFIATGVLGLLWLVPWVILYHAPSNTPEETTLDPEPSHDRTIQVDAPPEAIAWRILLRQRQVWAMILSRFLADPVWWLYVTWLPLYLFHVRHFNLGDIGRLAWIPFVAADAGSITGGWLSGFLIARGLTVDRARKLVIAFSVILMCAGALIAFAATTRTTLALISLVLFGFTSWSSNVQTLASDWFPNRAVGSVTGLGGVGAGVGAILLTQLTGYVVDHYSYSPIFAAAALLPIVATVLLFGVGGEIKSLCIEDLQNHSLATRS